MWGGLGNACHVNASSRRQFAVKPVRKLGVQKEELVEDKGGTTKGNAQKCHKEICMYVFIFQLT